MGHGNIGVLPEDTLTYGPGDRTFQPLYPWSSDQFIFSKCWKLISYWTLSRSRMFHLVSQWLGPVARLVRHKGRWKKCIMGDRLGPANEMQASLDMTELLSQDPGGPGLYSTRLSCMQLAVCLTWAPADRQRASVSKHKERRHSSLSETIQTPPII